MNDSNGVHSASRSLRARMMFLVLTCLLAAAAAAPATYDQRQEGEFNVRADVQNILFLVAVPKGAFSRSGLASLPNFRHFRSDPPQKAQDRSDVNVNELEKPSEPNRVQIDSKESMEEGAVEVVIIGKPSEPEPTPEKQEQKAVEVEQCGPDSERDPVTLKCRPLSKSVPNETPEIVPASS